MSIGWWEPAETGIRRWAHSVSARMFGFADETAKLGEPRPVQPGRAILINDSTDYIEFPVPDSLANVTLELHFEYSLGQQHVLNLLTSDRYIAVTLNCTRDTLTDLTVSAGPANPTSNGVNRSLDDGLIEGTIYVLVVTLDAASELIGATIDGIDMPVSANRSRVNGGSNQHRVAVREGGGLRFTGMISYYALSGFLEANMEEGTADVLLDSSVDSAGNPNGNHGEIGGSIEWVEEGSVKWSKANERGFTPGYYHGDVLTPFVELPDRAIGTSVNFRMMFHIHNQGKFCLLSDLTTPGRYILTSDNGSSSQDIHSNAGTPTVLINGVPFTPTDRNEVHDTIPRDRFIDLQIIGADTSSWGKVVTSFGVQFGFELEGIIASLEIDGVPVTKDEVTLNNIEMIPIPSLPGGIRDVSGNNLVCPGPVPKPILAHSSSCLTFDHVDDKAVMASHPLLGHAGDWTMCAWAMLTSTGNFPMIISTNSAFHVDLRFKGGTRQLQCNTQVGIIANLTSDAVTPTNTWIHAAVTFEAATKEFRLYADGVEVATDTGNGTQIDFGDSLAIGARINGNYLAGSIMDVRFFKTRILDFAKIMSGLNEGSEVAHYPFAEGDGATVYNAVASENNGALVGGPAWGLQDFYHRNFYHGHTKSGAVRIPVRNGTLLDAAGNPLMNPPGGNNDPETLFDFTSGQPLDPAVFGKNYPTAYTFGDLVPATVSTRAVNLSLEDRYTV